MLEISEQEITAEQTFNGEFKQEEGLTVVHNIRKERSPIQEIQQILKTNLSETSERIEASVLLEKKNSEFRKKEQMPVISETCEKFYSDVEEIMNNQQFEKSKVFFEDLKEIYFVKYTNPGRYKWDRPNQYLQFIKKMEQLQEYQSYKNYLGLNIFGVKQNFKNRLRKQLVCSSVYFSSELIVNIENILTEDPLDLFQKRSQLSPQQKQVLFQIFNRNDEAKEYGYILRRPESRRLKIIKVFKVLMDSFIEVIENKNERELFGALLENNKEKFYNNPFVMNHRLRIYEILEKQSPLFFYEQEIKTKTCPQQADVDLRLKIRKWIHDRDLGYELYEGIENIVMSNNLIELWKMKISNQEREELIQFYRKQDEENCYGKILLGKVYLKVSVKAEIERILIGLNLKDLNIGMINKIADNFVERGFLMKEYFSPHDFKRFNSLYQKSEVSKAYFEAFLSDVEQQKDRMRKELIYTIAKIHDLAYNVVCQILDKIVNRCDMQSLMDSNNLTNNQKQYLCREIMKIEQFERLKSCYRVVQAKIYRDEWKDELSKKFSMSEAELLMDFYQLYGDIQFVQNKKLVETFSQSFQELMSQKRQLIVQLQENSAKYVNYRRSFIYIFDRKEELIKWQLCHWFENNIEDEQKVNLYQQNLMRDKFNVQDLELHWANQLKCNPSFTKYSQFALAKKNLCNLREKIELENFICDLPLWEIAPFINKQKRRALIKGLTLNGIQFLKTTQFLENEEKQNIKKIFFNFNKQHEVEEPVVETFVVSGSPILSDFSSKQKALDYLFTQFKGNTEFISSQFSKQLLQNNLKADSFSNSDQIKKFIKAIGVNGLKNVNGIKKFIQTSKQSFQQYLDTIFSEGEKYSPKKESEEIVLQKIEKRQISIEGLLEQLKMFSEVPKNLNEKRLKNTLTQDPKIYESEQKLSKFMKNFGIKEEEKLAGCSSYFRENQIQIERVIESL